MYTLICILKWRATCVCVCWMLGDSYPGVGSCESSLSCGGR